MVEEISFWQSVKTSILWWLALLAVKYIGPGYLFYADPEAFEKFLEPFDEN